MKNAKIRDKRKILLFLPILILPFCALGFYALGGGKGHQSETSKNLGIRSTLPAASFGKEQTMDKMTVYQQQKPDSVEFAGSHLQQVADQLGFRPAKEEGQARDIDLKLQQLNAQINAPAELKTVSSLKERSITVPGMTSDVDRLEKLMSSMQGSEEEDQEIKQLSGLLEKVIDIQHPERVREAYLDRADTVLQEKFAAIPAEVSSRQKIRQGSVLKLVLSDSVTISGILLPKGQEIFGLCNLTNQRLMVDINAIRIGNNIIPVDLSIYSLDGIKGIAAPDAIVDNAISGGADDAVRSLQLLTADQSLGTQVAGAGIDAAKGLFSKKVKRIKMKIKSAFPVLLRDNQISK